MNKHQMMLQIRKKKLALLITDARFAVSREPEECACAMGVEPEVYNKIETGEISPSLPQLESLACFLNIQMDHFWGKSSKSDEGIWAKENVQERLDQQNQRISAKIRVKRELAGFPLETLADQTGINPDELQVIESGAKSISLPELETVCSRLEIDLVELFDDVGIIGAWHQQQRAAEIAGSLPEELLVFISQPVNHPYIRLAQKLSEMPAEKLRTIAENLLEITL